MSAETEILALLRGTPVLAGVAQGFFLNAADGETPLPYVVITATHASELLLSGEIDGESISFSIACWGVSASVAESVGDLVQGSLLRSNNYLVSARVGGFDQQTSCDACVITAEQWVT